MDYVEEYVNVDKEELCGYVDDAGILQEESPIKTVCDAWPDVCVGGVVELGKMCNSLDSQPESLYDMGLDWFCCDVSEWCIAEPEVFYMELVYTELCDSYADLCLNGSPDKDLLCQYRYQFETILDGEYVMDFDALCGYTDEDGNVVESETQPVCDSWPDMCTNNVPSVAFMCENIYDAPDAFFETFEVEEMDAFEFCYSAQDYEDFDVDAFCAEGSDFADVCIDGYPDFVKVCDTDFPPGTFDGSNYYQICELDFEDVCNTYSDLCDLEAHTISSDVCSIYPEKCDVDSDEYNPCAANLYDCMMDPDFYLCYEFSELCGYESYDGDDFGIPEPWPVPGGQTIKKGDTHTTITCKAELYDSWYNIEALIDSANYFYNANITAGNSWEFAVKQGIRSYAQIDNVPTQVGEGDASLYLFVPELSIFFNYDEAEEIFDDIFGVDESTGHYDSMGEYWGWGEYLDESTNEYVYLYNHVEFGY